MSLIAVSKVVAFLGSQFTTGASYDQSLNTTDDVTFNSVRGGNLKLSGNIISSEDVNGNIEITPNGTGTFVVNTDAHITGNLIVDGTKTIIDSETVAYQDNYLSVNYGYETAVAQSGGLVVNFLPTATQDTVSAGAFVAGVTATSNPTVATVGAATFSAGDIIQITGTENGQNDGLYEVLSHAANLLTIRGVGLTTTVEAFSNNQFTANASDNATITKVNVSVLRANTSGSWEFGSGAATGISYKSMAVRNGALASGSVIFATTSNLLEADSGNFSYNSGTSTLSVTNLSTGNIESSGNLLLKAAGSNNVSIYTNSVERFKVNAIGEIVAIGGPMTSRSSVAGIAGSAADENSFELGEGYLNLSRDNSAEAQQIRFNKNGSLHSGIKTNAAGFNIFGSDGDSDVTVDTSGNVGIGTTNPSAGAIGGKVLHLQHSGGGASVRVDRSDASTAGTLSITSGDTTNGIYSTGAKDLVLYTNSTEVARIDSTGQWGIGTTAPVSKFTLTNDDYYGSSNINDADVLSVTSTIATYGDVTGAITTSEYLGGYAFQAYDTTSATGGGLTKNAGMFAIAGKTFSVSSSSIELSFRTGVDGTSAEAVRIDQDGQVGIGTTNPSAGAIGGKVLHLQHSGATASVRVDRSDAATAGTLSISSGNLNNSIFSTGAKDLAFYTNSTERMRLDSSGDFVVGSSSADGRRFRVTKDSADVDVKFDTTTSGKAALIISGYEANTNLATTSSGAKLTLQNSNGTAGNYSSIIGVDSGGATMSQIAFVNVDHTNNEGEIAFFTRPSGGSITERMRIDSSGNLSIKALNKIITNSGSGGNNYIVASTSGANPNMDIYTAGLKRASFTYDGQFLAPSGSASSPAVAGVADTDTGMYFLTGNQLGFSTGGTTAVTIDSSGHLLVGTTDNTPYNNSTSAGTGTSIGPNGQIWNHADNGDLGTWNRTGSDGSIFLINRDGSTVATVSVSSGTVTWGTFCGGHNSQFADKSQPEIERGTVMASIDELVEWKTVRWVEDVTETYKDENGDTVELTTQVPKQADYYGDEPVGAVFTDDDGNEKTVHAKKADQLPKCEISNTKGDKTAYGTFSHYDDNGTPIIHGLGQTVVRVTGPVENGDLLMSNGDGTACLWDPSYGYAAVLGKCRQGKLDAGLKDVNLLAYTCYAG